MHKAGWTHLLGSKLLWLMFILAFLMHGIYMSNSMPDATEYKKAWNNISSIAKKDRNMLSDEEYYVLKEYRHEQKYSKRIETICREAEYKLRIPLFYKKSAYIEENLRKTQQEYQKIKDISFSVSPGLGVINGTDGLLMSLLILLLILEAVRLLYIEDWEASRRGLLLAAKHGRGLLFLAKTAVLFEFTVLIFILFQGSKLLYACQNYSFGDLRRAIQSVWTFELMTKQWSVGHYLFSYVSIQLAVILVAMLIIQAIAVLTKKGIWLYLIAVCIGGVEFVLYKTISADSWLSILRHVNVFSYLQTEDRLGTYNNLNILGTCTNELTCMGTVLVTVAVFSFFFGWVLFRKTKHRRNFVFAKHRKKYRGAKCTLWRHECYKILWTNRAIIFIIILVVIQILTSGGYDSNYEDEDSFYYYHYVHRFEGNITSETIAQIEAEKQNFKDWNYQINKEKSEFERQKLQKKLNAEKGFAKFYLLYKKQLKNGSNFILDSRATNTLVGNQLILWCEGIICLLFILYCIWCVDRQNGIEPLLRTTRFGYTKRKKIQWIISLLLTTSVYLIAFAPTFLHICRTYHFEQWMAPAKSMEQFYLWPAFSSVKTYVTLTYLFRYLTFLVVMIVGKQVLCRGGRKK